MKAREALEAAASRWSRVISLPLDLDNDLPNSLMTFGGTLAFDDEINFHFEMETGAGPDEVDFYSIALHEIGHCFGMCTAGVGEWRELLDGTDYLGTRAQEAYEAFDSLPDRSYWIQSSTTGKTWVNVQPMIESEGEVTDWEEGEPGFFDPNGSAPAGGKKVYRVVSP